MSIASRITSIEEHIGNAYDSINKFGVDTSVINKNIENIANVINDEIYDKLPKVTGSGSEFTLTPVQNGQVDDFKMNGVDLEQNQLPSEYTAVEYLQSDEHLYIDTGINADNNLSLELKMSSNDHTSQKHMGAIKNDNGVYTRHHITLNPTNWYIASYTGITSSSNLLLTNIDNNKHYLNLDIYNKEISVDNQSPITLSFDTFDTGVNYWLFARNSNNDANRSYLNMKLYFCKMYYQGIIVRDFVPCYRNSDNTAGLYDFVTNTFFTKQGTGTFTVGNNIVLPNPDYPQEIKVVEGRQVITDKGKNLFDKDNANIITAYIGDSYNWTFSGSAICYRINCKPNTSYTISCANSNETIFRGSVTDSEDIPTSGNNLSIYSTVRRTNNSPITVNTGANAKYVLVQLSNTQYLTSLETLQVEEGSTATDYEPYYNPLSYNIDLNLENIYLAKMPNTDYKNRIYRNNGNWYFEEKVKKIVLDGSQYWDLANSGTDNYSYRLVLGRRIINGYGISSHYPYQSSIVASNTVEGFNILNITNTTSQIRIRYGTEQTTENFRSWLSNHNVTVWYVLENSTTTQITNTTLINQLEALYLHTGTNIITISNDNNIIPEIEITRLKELEKLS